MTLNSGDRDKYQVLLCQCYLICISYVFVHLDRNKFELECLVKGSKEVQNNQLKWKKDTHQSLKCNNNPNLLLYCDFH